MNLCSLKINLDFKITLISPYNSPILTKKCCLVLAYWIILSLFAKTWQLLTTNKVLSQHRTRQIAYTQLTLGLVSDNSWPSPGFFCTIMQGTYGGINTYVTRAHPSFYIINLPPCSLQSKSNDLQYYGCIFSLSYTDTCFNNFKIIPVFLREKE